MKKALIGFGGHALEVMSQMRESLPCFVSDNLVNEMTLPISSFDPDKYMAMIAISNPILRRKIINQLPSSTKYFSFIHPTSLILGDVKIGEGSFIGALSILTIDIEIGNHAILNRCVQIGHNSRIGDFFSAMPGSVVSGNCHIGTDVYLGTNSSVREKITICDSVIIGLSSGVVKNITVPGVYGGVPCKKIK